MIFVTVGSRKYPFDRLFKKLDELYEMGILTDDMFAQIGMSKYKPKHFEYKDFISPEEFMSKINEADIVVSHGASGSIMKALNAGKKVIAVTRLEKYGEHINDHQIQNNQAFSLNNYVLMADLELSDLGECFQKIYSGTDKLLPWENKDPMKIVNLIDRFIKQNWDNVHSNIKCKAERDKRIVFFTNRMTGGGSERVISYLANALVEKYDVTILTMTCAESDYFLHDKVKHQPLEDEPAKNNHSLVRNISRLIRLKKFIKKNPEALYISFVTLPSYILLYLKKYITKGKAIVAVRNDPKASHKSWIDKLLVKWLYPKADAFVFQTKEAEQFYDFIKIKESVILPNPINEKFIQPPYAGVRKKEVVSVGRLIEQKNHKMLINAFASVHERFPDYTLKIYGEGYLRDQLQNQINMLGMEQFIQLKGSVSDLQDKIYDASLFVLSSDFEGMPNALLEAMSLGLPVISTRCSGGGPEMIIEDCKNGLLVPVGDTQKMAEAICKVLSNSELAENMSRMAHNIVERFSPEGTIQCWEGFLEKFLI